MKAKQRGNPVITLRLPPADIAAGRICAREHGTTLSGLMRDLLREKVQQEGIAVKTAQIPGQIAYSDLKKGV